MKADTARFEKRSRVRAKTSRAKTGRLALEVPQRKALPEEAGNTIFIMMADNLSGFRFDRGLPIRRRIGLIGNLKHAQIIFSVPEDHHLVKPKFLTQSRHTITLAAIAMVIAIGALTVGLMTSQYVEQDKRSKEQRSFWEVPFSDYTHGSYEKVDRTTGIPKWDYSFNDNILPEIREYAAWKKQQL